VTASVPDIALGVGEFVALVNQTFDYAYPQVALVGELANFRVSKGKWVYFDLKDELASLRFFGTVYMLPGPLEDGMLLQVTGSPRLHPQYGFSVNVQKIQPVGEGTIRRAAELLQAKLVTEGLFDAERKRPLPHPPERIGLIASKESAAYIDFMKILNARWGGVDVELIDVQVQGDLAPEQIVAAIKQFNAAADPPDVLVLTRGGGSAEDLQAFSTESVTRAVAESRVPTMVAIGHERDVSLAELAADQRASTPSNAAELLVPDKTHELQLVQAVRDELQNEVMRLIDSAHIELDQTIKDLDRYVHEVVAGKRLNLTRQQQLLAVLSPEAALQRGYAIVRSKGAIIKHAKELAVNDIVNITFGDGQAEATVTTRGK
jgi:exodeoxyribonuclease VII large subunit